MEKQAQIAVLGSANYDYFFEVTEFPVEGETIQANNSFTANGGKGANQAVAAGRLIGEALFVGQMGEDEKATSLEKEMHAAGVNTKFTKKLVGVPTGHAYIMLNSKGQNIIIIVGGANMSYKDLNTLPEEYTNAIDSCNFLLLQREIPNEINVLASKYAKSKGKTVMLDYGGRDDPFPEEMLNYLDFISPNETELTRLLQSINCPTGDNSAIKENLLKKYPNLKVLLKLGSHGCQLITKDLDIPISVVSTFNDKIMEDFKIVNTTGAGDCFTAAFMVRYSQLLGGKEEEKEIFRKSMLFANACAFLCITKEGAMPAMPSINEVNEFISKYLKDLGL